MKKFFLVLTFILFAGFTFAGTTGSIVGKVTDSTGAPLPGVTVVATSPSLQGQKTTTTNADGKYRLVLLPPGVYTLKYSLAGFQATVKKNVKVNLDVVTTVNAVLKEEGVSEQIEVVAEKPLIDVTTTTTGANYSTDYVEQMPTARNYLSVVQLTPGVTGSDISGGMIVNGASGTESNYIVDGLNTTDLEYGTQGKGLNFDFVEEVQVKTGGFEPEFGRATGAVVNVITKSGGNEFHGSVFYYWRNPSYSAQSPVSWRGSNYLGTKEYDYGFSLGGYIIKDKLWFFLAYNPSVNEYYYQVQSKKNLNRDEEIADGLPETNDIGTTVAALRGESTTYDKNDRDYWALKLTYNINENHTVVASFFGDPRDYYSRHPYGTLSRDRKTSQGGTDWTVKYDGILNENLVISAQYGYHYQENKDKPLYEGGDTTPATYMSKYLLSKGGLGYMDDTEMERDEYKLSVEWFLANHDIKFGYDYEDNKFDSGRKYSGGHYNILYYGYHDTDGSWVTDLAKFQELRIRQRYFVKPDPNGSLMALDGQLYYETGEVKFIPVSPLGDEYLRTKTKTEYTAVYLQDKWQITDNFLLSYGLRWEEQKIKGNSEEYGGEYTAIDIDDAYAPRIGFTWDVFGDGTSKLYAHWGRFYEYIPMDINNRAFGNEILWDSFSNYVNKSDIPDVDTNGDGMIDFWDFDESLYNLTPYGYSFGFHPSHVSKNLNGQSTDEFILGYDYLLNDLWSVGVKFTWRELNDVIEDVSFDGGNTYIIANPGRDIIYDDYDGNEVYVPADQTGFRKPKRNYRAYELKLKRKFADGWTVDASIIRSDLWGDYIGGVLPFYGQVDPNLTAAYDLPSTLVNTNGPLPYDRPWQIKVNGLYQYDWGLNVGFTYSYMSGTPIAAYGDPASDYTGYYGEFRLIRNGAPGLGRTDAVQSLDLNFSYTYDIGKYGSVTGYFYIFNVFNWKAVTAVSQRLTYDVPSEDYINTNFGGSWDNWIHWIDGRFGSLSELEEYMDSVGMKVDEHFMDPLSWQTPRYIRFGIKYKF